MQRRRLTQRRSAELPGLIALARVDALLALRGEGLEGAPGGLAGAGVGVCDAKGGGEGRGEGGKATILGFGGAEAGVVGGAGGGGDYGGGALTEGVFVFGVFWYCASRCEGGIDSVVVDVSPD